VIHRVLALLLVWSAVASAAPLKVLVLPIDGDADPAQRKQLSAVVLDVAKGDGRDVALGTTTFAETALAAGCDPHEAGCVETVLATLGVDEIVFGTATTSDGQTTLVASRVAKGEPRKDQTVAIAAGEPTESAAPQLRGLYGTAPAATEGSAASVPVAEAPAGDSFFATRERKIGFGCAAAGGLVFLIGLALWSSESSVQTQIDNAPTSSPAQIRALLALEDKANGYAWEGNVLVVLGLAAGGVGAYYLWQDHKLRATVTPVAHDTGAAVVIGGTW
jgi:hypothetical protein